MRPFLDRLDPALVAPMVAYLAHADCPVSGEIYTVGAGHVARFFIGRTRGYHHPELSVEDVAAQLDQIRNTADLHRARRAWRRNGRVVCGDHGRSGTLTFSAYTVRSSADAVSVRPAGWR
ncbi:hypothetical protein BH09ACT4_BH09ACT4_01650 [soil metagenome]